MLEICHEKIQLGRGIMMKSFYVIIRGPLGIGKTTIAKELAKKLNAEHILFDKVLEENELDRKDSDYAPEDYLKANEIALPKAKILLDKGIPVIFDGCFYFKEQIEDIVEKLNYPAYIFTLKASVNSCIGRDSKRERIYGEKAAREVHELVSKFDVGMIIDTENKTSKEVVKEILEKIR